MPWTPSYHRERWGRLQVVASGQDVTFYRGVPAQVDSWESGEPFGDATARIRFPQITAHEPLPWWLAGSPDVEINVVRPNGQVDRLWEGMVAAPGDDHEGSYFECMGALFQADLYRQQPRLHPGDPVDLAWMIAEAIDPARRPGLRTLPLSHPLTGILLRRRGGWEPVLTGHVAGLLAQAVLPDGTNQWTVHLDPWRRPVLRLKDRTSAHHVVHTAAPGVTHDLTLDLIGAPNTIYGEGVDELNCRWRNSKYPNLRRDPAPVFPGRIINVGESGADMLAFERELYGRGWTGFGVDGSYSSREERHVREFQRQAGIQVDGDIGPQTWAAAFQVGRNQGDLEGAWIMPLAWIPEVEPYTYDANGAITGSSPHFNPAVPRVERYENYGARISKEEATRSAQAEIARDHPAGYAGTVTLATDPEGGSRFEIRAGQNLLLRGHRGVDRLLHISGCSVEWAQGTVTLTVDEKARDLPTLAAVLQRDRETTDPARRKVAYFNSSSRTTEDRVAVWDCENGSGIIPRHATYRKLWNVLRIPVAHLGTIVRAEFTLDTPARFAVGIFNRETTHDKLRSVGDPLFHRDFWKQFGEDTGLIMAWGEPDQAMGFYPKVETGSDPSDEGPVTGRFVDGSPWYYESQTPPWLWVAIYVESPTINYIEGRLHPSNEWV